VSDLRVTSAAGDGGVTIPSGAVDVLLGCDLIGAASAPMLSGADPDRTVAIVSESISPTGVMATDIDALPPDLAAARSAIDAVTVADQNVFLDATRIAEELLGDATPANVVVLGAAYQRGLLPVSLQSLQEAFRLNAVEIDRNLAALA